MTDTQKDDIRIAKKVVQDDLKESIGGLLDAVGRDKIPPHIRGMILAAVPMFTGSTAEMIAQACLAQVWQANSMKRMADSLASIDKSLKTIAER